MAKKYKITLTITHVGGKCGAGCEIGKKYELSPIKTDNLCGSFYHHLFPIISVFNSGGELFFLKDKDRIEVRCPDYINDVRGTLEREVIGEWEERKTKM